MFWRLPDITAPARTARRALGLARAALLLEEPYEPVERRPSHPHRTELRESRTRHRGGSVLARPQHCITPVARPKSHTQLAGRR